MLHKLIHLEKIQYYSANITYSFHTVAVEEQNFNVLLKKQCLVMETRLALKS